MNQLVKKQNKFFDSQVTKDLGFRKKQLKKLLNLLIANEEMLYKAIYRDFKKSKFDTYTTEFSLLKKSIQYYLKNVSNLAKPESRAKSLIALPAKNKLIYEPLGTVLVIGAWNYPYLLSLDPMISAMAAGNTVILKPSEIAANSSAAMKELINANFDQDYIHVVEGGVTETQELLQERFDKIFFTGSTHVGKIIYQAAAKHLTPVTLELGGKSPTIITKSANIPIAAKRIAWGKFLNAGQTCVAPDYLLVDEVIHDELINELKQVIDTFDYTPENNNYPLIINERNFDRLVHLIDTEKIAYGGESDRKERFIQPTILTNITWEDNIMKEEIFGPILPVLKYKQLENAITEVAKREKPLAAYLFTNNQEDIKLFNQRISFGGGCINDVVIHLAVESMPFGGVGNSGIGQYHGEFGFKTFSHVKSLLANTTWGEPNFKYPPYTDKKLQWIKKLLG